MTSLWHLLLTWLGVKKMARTGLVVMFVYFLMICWRKQRRKQTRRRIRRMAMTWRRLQAFCDQQEDLCKIVATLIADRIICSTMQRRVLWVRNRSQSFTNVTASWDYLEWKINFHINRTTFSICALNLVGNLNMLAPCVQQYLLKQEWLLHMMAWHRRGV